MQQSDVLHVEVVPPEKVFFSGELRLHFKTNLGVQSTQLKFAVDTHVSPRPADSKHRPRGST